MSKPTFSISFSEYSNFRQCPHKWFLSYMLKIPDSSSEELIFGSMTHDSIEDLLTHKHLAKMNRNPIVIEGILKDNLKKQIATIKDTVFLQKMLEGWVAPTFVKQGKALLQELNINERFKEYEIIDVEIKLDGLPIIERDDVIITYKGFIDLVLRHKVSGRYLILDWKTSRKPWDITEKEKDDFFYAQLCLYKHFYSIKKEIPLDQIDLCFYNLPRDDARGQRRFDKTILQSEIDTFMDSFRSTCEKVYDFNHFELDKARFTTKKNWCSRCAYNTPHLCSDKEQYQVVELSLTEL